MQIEMHLQIQYENNIKPHSDTAEKKIQIDRQTDRQRQTTNTFTSKRLHREMEITSDSTIFDKWRQCFTERSP